MSEQVSEQVNEQVSEQVSEEEKKAIEYLKRHIMPYENEDGNIEFLINDVLLNLIDKQQKEIEILNTMKPLQELIDTNVIIADYSHNYISKDKIRERIKHNEKQKNIIESVGKFKINDDGITGEGIEGLNDLIVYKRYEAVINELNYLLEE